MKLFTLMQTSFENFDNSINNYLGKVFSDLGMNYGNHQVFKVIFNGIKGVFQNIMLYIEDAFVEQNIETATRKRSIYSLAKISGYEPYYGSAATGILEASLISNTNLASEIKKIYIDNHSYIENQRTGIRYHLYLQSSRYVFDISKPLVNYEMRIVQGNFIRNNYTSTGNTLETIHININGMFDKNYVQVYVNNVLWQPVSNLYDMNQDGEEYILTIGFDNELDIMFGNGVYGKIPERGSNITVEYILHNGEQGNISNISESNFRFVDNGYDYNGNQINLNSYIKLKINNPISGGTDSDTINDVRRMIGYNSRSNVLASIDNYVLFLHHFSFLGNYNVWAEENSNMLMISAITNKLSNLKDVSDYATLTDKDLLLSDEQKQNIITVLNNSKNTFAGISINFVDPIIYKYAIICYIKIDDKYFRDIIENEIQQTVIKYFSNFYFNVNFISKSDIIKVILDNVEHIKSINIDIISEINEQAYANNYYYKYETLVYNNRVNYNKVRYNYETNSNLGLDNMGNISLDSNLYIPLLHGDLIYYPDKSSFNKENTMRLDAVNVVFI